MPQVPEDDTLSTLSVKDIEFVNAWRVGEYTNQIYTEAEHIIQATLGSTQSYFKITALFTCMQWGKPYLFKDL